MKICLVGGCSSTKIMARGWCSAHYHRWQRYGDASVAVRKVSSWGDTECCVEGCGKRVYAKRYCEAHLAHLRRRANPEQQKARNAAFQARKRSQQESLMGRPRTSCCELCGNPPRGRGSKPEAGICFDHDHATGKPRGWLCDRCNKVLGLVSDSKTLLRILANYLEEHEYGEVNHVAQEVAAE